jgi:hypothetical protein
MSLGLVRNAEWHALLNAWQATTAAWLKDAALQATLMRIACSSKVATERPSRALFRDRSRKNA